MTITKITALPPAPVITDTESQFASKASTFVSALDGFVTDANALASDVDSALAGTLVQFDGFAGVWSAGTFNSGQVVFHTPSDAFYIALQDGETAEPPGGNWQQLGTAESTSYDNTTSGLTAINVQAAVDEVAEKEPQIANTTQAQEGTSNDTFITPLRMREGFNATGSAPVYACRAWVNFDGTGTVSIRDSGNVSSITDNGEADYTVNFTTAMPDADYSAVLSGRRGDSGGNGHTNVEVLLSGSVQVRTGAATGGILDHNIVCVSIFR